MSVFKYSMFPNSAKSLLVLELLLHDLCSWCILWLEICFRDRRILIHIDHLKLVRSNCNSGVSMALTGWDCVTWDHVFPLWWLLDKDDTFPHAFQPVCQVQNSNPASSIYIFLFLIINHISVVYDPSLLRSSSDHRDTYILFRTISK